SMPVDFDGDGVEELLLEVNETWSMRQFYTLLEGNDVRLLPLPITGIYGDAVTRGMPETGQLTILDVADLDYDGGDELILEGDRYGYWASCGDLYVIDEQNGELVNRTDGLFNY